MWQRTKNFFNRFLTAFDKWSEDGCSLLAASLAYYVALTLFPVMLVLLSVLGFFLESTDAGRDAKSQLLDTISDQVSPALEQQVESVLDQVSLQAGVGGPVGVIVLLITSVGIFSQLDYAFMRIWKTSPPTRGGFFWNAVKDVLFTRAKAFLMLLALGGLILAIFISGFVLSALEEHIAHEVLVPDWTLRTIQVVSTIVINAVVFTLLYRFVPRVLVPWRAAIRGGLVATFIWEIGRQGMAMYMVRSEYGSAYGVLGSFLAIMLWAYFGAAVILYGAVYAHSVEVGRSGKPETPNPEPVGAQP